MSDQIALTEPARRCVSCRREYQPVVGERIHACPDCMPRVVAQARRIGTDPGLPFGGSK